MTNKSVDNFWTSSILEINNFLFVKTADSLLSTTEVKFEYSVVVIKSIYFRTAADKNPFAPYEGAEGYEYLPLGFLW